MMSADTGQRTVILRYITKHWPGRAVLWQKGENGSAGGKRNPEGRKNKEQGEVKQIMMR